MVRPMQMKIWSRCRVALFCVCIPMPAVCVVIAGLLLLVCIAMYTLLDKVVNALERRSEREALLQAAAAQGDVSRVRDLLEVHLDLHKESSLHAAARAFLSAYAYADDGVAHLLLQHLLRTLQEVFGKVPTTRKACCWAGLLKLKMNQQFLARAFCLAAGRMDYHTANLLLPVMHQACREDCVCKHALIRLCDEPARVQGVFIDALVDHLSPKDLLDTVLLPPYRDACSVMRQRVADALLQSAFAFAAPQFPSAALLWKRWRGGPTGGRVAWLHRVVNHARREGA